MDSRERTFLALEHRIGDRIPRDFWASKAMIGKLERDLDIPYHRFLDRYDVEYVYVGPRERATYGTEGLSKFASFMETVFSQDDVEIFRRVW